MKKVIALLIVISTLLFMFCSCVEETGSYADTKRTKEVGDKIQQNQPTPTDIEYSLERYNLIKRAYWVNGQKEEALSVPCPIQRPLGYIILFTGSAVVGKFTVDGKVSSLNSFLTPDSEYYGASALNRWLADVDGSYGTNDSGIFFFTVDGKYIEWTGQYMYSDTPLKVDNPIVSFEEVSEE